MATSTQSVDDIILKLNEQLGDRQCYSIAELIDAGIFGSRGGAWLALKKGLVTFIQISPGRRVVPRAALIDFLEKNCVPAFEKKKEAARV